MKISYFMSALILFISGLLITGSAIAAKKMGKELSLKKGDVVTQQSENGSWSVVKVLELDEWPDGTFTAHCLTYKPTLVKPNINSLKFLEVFAFHAPIDASSFSNGWDLVGNAAPKQDELVGFIEYLKLTDFQRYADVTDQDVRELITEANKNYKNAIAAGESGDHKQALLLYSNAIEIFPLFYEAIDNRAFTHMDLGDYNQALHDFQLSLQVNPDGLTAFFSAGECLLKLENYDEAMKIFAAGEEKFPEESGLFNEFYNKAFALSKEG